MTTNKNDHVVIALFDSEDFANYGIDLLKKWDYATEEIKLGAIGVITKKGGKIKTHVPHKTGSGATIGALLGVIAAVLTGGASWIVAGVGGSAIGAITGTFFKKSLHLTKDEIEALGKQLDGGKVAVVVTCDAHEVEETSKHLHQFGGAVSNYTVPDEALTEAKETLPSSDATTIAATAQSQEAIAEATEVDLATISQVEEDVDTINGTNSMLGPTTQSPI